MRDFNLSVIVVLRAAAKDIAAWIPGQFGRRCHSWYGCNAITDAARLEDGSVDWHVQDKSRGAYLAAALHCGRLKSGEDAFSRALPWFWDIGTSGVSHGVRHDVLEVQAARVLYLNKAADKLEQEMAVNQT